MDPNFVGNCGADFYNSDPNYWDLNGQYQNLFNFTNSDPFYQFDADANDPLSFSTRDTSFFNSSVVEAQVVSSEPYNLSSLEDSEFSETARYISQILMEENFEQKPCMYYDPLSLQITEKSFSDALIEKLPHSPDQHPLDIHQNLESPDGNCSGSTSSADSGSSGTDNRHELKPLPPDTPVSGDYTFQLNSDSTSHLHSQLPQHALTSISNGMLDLDSSVTKLLAQNIFSDADSMLQFRRGLEEASKFLPQGTQLFTGVASSSVSLKPKDEVEKVAVKTENGVRENSYALKSRKNHEREGDGVEEEGRSNKQSAVSSVEESGISEMFDRVLLSIENVPLHAEQQDVSVIDSNEQPSEQPPSSNRGKSRLKKQGRKKETVDLRTLLILCAQAVSAGDNRTANELLKQIRQHSSPLGDASQRLAHYFGNGLEARLVGAGTGTQIFINSPSYKKFTAADFLKAYQVYISACPFKKLAHFFANKTILKAAENAETLHIIDFGILYGFQWPILIKFLSKRSGGPPKLRITGIEYPQPGFRPSERIEETGHCLANYCKRFNVPFEFKAIASRNWETILIDDLKIKSNEVLAVNCLIRFRNLLDETIEVNSPRNAVLNLIRKINPDVFVQSIVNGSYNAPFFATRFREALFHFSAIYDMYDTLIPRSNEWRLMIEREISGREIMNVVACEGFERVERPETYKQWQARNTRAGFKQIPLDKELMTGFRRKIREWYQHDRDFVFDEDNNWMLQGWKGRVLYASAAWVPA
ncbi:hypothetical protein TanjilG_11325 [Lupinus angustifolius]|uniref:Uncharacterized protein n=1 Tax=Lupinus angustifolius TaxID=3871 RepID=A0A1J7I8K0_LUPAN|nr:PREDICTED: scarecrow-like protein 34 [Lupinus angustifolius]OIW09187.1 hypothetical protein TanjilG_11325 [Lupinus angustifolius]